MKWFDAGTKTISVPSFGNFIKLIKVQCTGTWVSPLRRPKTAASAGREKGAPARAASRRREPTPPPQPLRLQRRPAGGRALSSPRARGGLGSLPLDAGAASATSSVGRTKWLRPRRHLSFGSGRPGVIPSPPPLWAPASPLFLPPPLGVDDFHGCVLIALRLDGRSVVGGATRSDEAS